MFERFTDRARRVVNLAQQEACSMNHSYIGTEHVLLGLIYDQKGIAAQVLIGRGITLDKARATVEEIVAVDHRPSTATLTRYIPFTPRAKKVLELSLREALNLGHNYIGTEHILLGLVREGEGVAAQTIVKLGVDLSTLKNDVLVLVPVALPQQPLSTPSEVLLRLMHSPAPPIEPAENILMFRDRTLILMTDPLRRILEKAIEIAEEKGEILDSSHLGDALNTG